MLFPPCNTLKFIFRLMYEKSIKAFVSFAQFYLKHDCRLLFKIKGT